MPGIRLKLIDHARDWWRLWSIRIGALGTVLASTFVAFPDIALNVWNMLPADIKQHFPPEYVSFFGIGLFALSMFARVIRQDKLKEKQIERESQYGPP